MSTMRDKKIQWDLLSPVTACSWFDDNQINSLLMWIFSGLTGEKLCLLPTYFYTCAKQWFHDHSCGHGQLSHMLNKIDIFASTHLVIPVLEDRQWMLAVVQWPVLYIFDSLKSHNASAIASVLRGVIQFQADNKFGTRKRVYDEAMFPLIYPDCQQQENTYDCGLFVLRFADRLKMVLENGGQLQPVDVLYVGDSKLTRRFLSILIAKKCSAGYVSGPQTLEDTVELNKILTNLTKTRKRIKTLQILNGRLYQFKTERNGSAWYAQYSK